jgi:hypothetical protein
MPRSKAPKQIQYADPADLNPITPLRLQFMQAVQSHPDAAAAFLRGLHEKVWPLYRNLNLDADWPTIQRASRTELIPIRERLTQWAQQLHFLNAAGEPCPWLIVTALGMVRRWKYNPQRKGEFLHGGEYLLFPSELPPLSPLAEKFQKLTFSFHHSNNNGMPLAAYEMELRAAVNAAVDTHLGEMREVAEQTGKRTPEKRSLDLHFGWLMQNLVLGRSAAQIIEHSPSPYRGASSSSVSEALRSLAPQLGLKPHTNVGGRPRKSLSTKR